MIGFAPFDSSEAGPPSASVTPRRQPRIVRTSKTTECNYIVMFFIIGVMLLALGDLKRS